MFIVGIGLTKYFRRWISWRLALAAMALSILEDAVFAISSTFGLFNLRYVRKWNCNNSELMSLSVVYVGGLRCYHSKKMD